MEKKERGGETMKIWIRKDLKKNSIMLAFKNANEIFYGDLEPVLYIHVDIEKWTEIDLEEFTKEDHETGISRIVFQCPTCSEKLLKEESDFDCPCCGNEDYVENYFHIEQASGGDVISLKEAQENLKGYVAKCKQEEKEFNEQRDTALDLEGCTKPPEPIRETVEEFNKRLDLEIKIENKLIAAFIQFLGYYQLEWAPQLSEAMSKELFEEHKKWEAKLK